MTFCRINSMSCTLSFTKAQDKHRGWCQLKEHKETKFQSASLVPEWDALGSAAETWIGVRITRICVNSLNLTVIFYQDVGDHPFVENTNDCRSIFAWHAWSPGFEPWHHTNWVWWCTPIISVLGKWEVWDQDLKVILGYVDESETRSYYIRSREKGGEEGKGTEDWTWGVYAACQPLTP